MATTNTPRAKWFVIAFHWEMAALLVLLGIGSVAMALFARQGIRWPWIRWTMVVVAVMGPPVFGYFAYRIIRHALWLQGRGRYAEPIIGPPPRANAALTLLIGPLLILIGISGAGPLVFKIALTLAGVLATAFAYPAVRWAWARETSVDAEQ